MRLHCRLYKWKFTLIEEVVLRRGKGQGVYNPRRNHGANNGLSPEEMEKQNFRELPGV